jgi:hypothetical protein
MLRVGDASGCGDAIVSVDQTLKEVRLFRDRDNRTYAEFRIMPSKSNESLMICMSISSDSA